MVIWFRHLVTDWFTRRQPELKDVPFVLATPVRGRKLIKAVNGHAAAQGVATGMVLADAKAVLPALQVFDEEPGLAGQLLQKLAVWCIRYTPLPV
jgi:protein ImuB